MGKGLNKVQLIGRLGKDVEIKFLQSGVAVARFSLATDESWTDKRTGEKQTRTEWHSIQAWDKLAEICEKYLAKGRQIYCEGKIQSREYTDKEGVKRKAYEIVIDSMLMLGDSSGAKQETGAVPDSWEPPGQSSSPSRNGPAARSEYDDSGDPW